MKQLLAEPPLRQAFGRLGRRTLIAWDGTEYFCSQKLGCPHCLTRQRQDRENYIGETSPADSSNRRSVSGCKRLTEKELSDLSRL
jgi:hypothetical protein